MKFYFDFIYYCCFGLAMLYRMISDFTWQVSTGPEKENLIFSLFSATPGRDIQDTDSQIVIIGHTRHK